MNFEFKIMQKERLWDCLTLALCLIVLTFGLGGYGLYEPHEGHFAGVAREMLLRGDWVTPYLNGSPYLNKPPLLYWLIATSTAIFGVNEWAARLPLAIAAWFGCLVALQWARDLWSPKAGCIAALMLSVSTGWFMFCHQILIDVLLSTLLLGSYYCLWKLSQSGRWRYFFGLYILLGLCVLTKGPFALVFPVAGGLGLAIRQKMAKLPKFRLGLGLGVILAVVLPWAIAIENANPGFLQYFVFNENLSRIADKRFPPDYEVSKVSALGYLGITAVWCIPWILVLPQAIYRGWQDWQKGIQREGILLLAIASLVPILLFLPLSSRLIYYSIPAIPPIIILCANWWAQPQKGKFTAGIVFAFLGLIVASGAVWIPSLVTSLPELSNLPNLGGLIRAIALSMGLGLLLGGLIAVKRPNLALIGLFIGLFSTYIAVTSGFGSFQDIRSSKTLIQIANPRLGSETLWTFEGSRELGAAGAMSYYLSGSSNRIVKVLIDGGTNRLPPSFPGAKPGYAMTKQELQAYWNSDRPAVFVTDFLRQPNDSSDPPTLNLPKNSGEPLLIIATRKLYGNAAARKLWLKN